jgi:hypothetical protein
LWKGILLQKEDNNFRKWPGLKMKSNRALGAESSKRKKKLSAVDAEEDEDTMSPITLI